MALADELLQSGDLDGARSALIEVVRKTPQDQPARLFLFQLLCLTGEWDKAQTQLRTYAQLNPEAQMLSVAYGQAIEAEKLRAEVFAGRAAPAILVNTSPWAGDLAAALGAEAAGRHAEAEERRALAFDAAPDTPGQIDGEAFDWIGDADYRFGPTFEAIISGKWGLLPFEAIERIESEGPVDLRDLVWYPVQVAFKTGNSVAAMLPARYPGTEASDQTDLKLSRGTDWKDGANGQTGVGQHLLTLSDGSDRGLLSLRKLTFS